MPRNNMNILTQIKTHRLGPRLADHFGITYQAFRERIATTRHGKGYNGRNYREPFDLNVLSWAVVALLREDIEEIKEEINRIREEEKESDK